MLDGVTITGGRANGASPHNNGGGMLNNTGNPTLNRCTFSLNSAVNAGGGMHNYASSPTVTNCAFNGNTCDHVGGGMNNGAGSTSTLVNCTFAGNAAVDNGGAMHNWESSPTLVNCSLAGNSAQDEGGGIYNHDNNPTLTNCIVWGNTAWTGGQIRNDAASASVTYSCVQDGWPGEGNIDGDPQFVGSPNPGPDGQRGTLDDDYGDLRLVCGSPCLDAGTNTTDPPLPATDADGNPRVVNGIVDMGAYEGVVGNAFVTTPTSVVVPEGESAQFTVALACDPNGPVDVDVSFASGDSDISVATPMPLAFDSSNYWIPQSVTLTAAEDSDQLEGTTIIAVTAPGIPPAQVGAREDENDVPSLLYVDASATGAADGTSWANAYPELFDALAFAATFSGVDEIRVADGIYAPDPTGLDDPREATFQLLDGLMIAGGYAGFGAPDPDARDVTVYDTVLSGDIDGADNCYHVVTGSGTDATAGLDGVTITGGYANGPNPHNCGGGMFNEGGNPTLTQCTFSENVAYGVDYDEHDEQWDWGRGGGIYNEGGSPALTDCTFTGNSAEGVRYYEGYYTQDYGTGGAINNTGGTPTLTNCTFTANLSHCIAGGMYNGNGGNSTLTNCAFRGNWARGSGGGMLNTLSSPSLVNCTFTANHAGGDGGGIDNWNNSSPVLINCTLTGNHAADDGGGIYNEWNSCPTLTNCIVWGNTSTSNQIDGTATATYSCIEGGWPGEGNIDADPRFARVPDAGLDGVWGLGYDDYGDLRLACGSPCLDAGTNITAPPLPPTDADGNPRILNGVVDMGAYEGVGSNAFVITPQSLVVPEGGSAEFTVALACDPGGPVSVDVSFASGDSDISVATAMPLSFDSSNYWIGQTVTLTAAEDTDQLEGSAVIDVTAAGTRSDEVEAHEVENDVPPVLYVDASATGADDGTSWTDAYPGLQKALTVASGSPGAVVEVHLAAGTYMPNASGLSDPRNATFRILNGLAICGGYAGFGAPDPDARDITAYETILSGDLDGNDDPNDFPGPANDFAAGPSYADNCYHVVTGNGTDATAVLDGVTITAGTADNSGPSGSESGGGMCSSNGHATLSNCTFARNFAYDGGGLHNYNSNPMLTSCTFTANSSRRSGAGVFIGNSARYNGGGIYNYIGACRPTLTNCTFSANSGGLGGAMYNYYENDQPEMTNCIAWANSGAQVYNADGAVTTVTYTCIQGGRVGEGNINADPMFVRPPDPGPDGEWGTGDDDYGDLHLTPGSPCVDAGDPNGDYTGQTDMDGEPRVMNGRVDMGADECSGVAWLVASDPPDGGTLAKTQANVIRLTFSWAIALPAGPALQIEPIGGGADVGDQFDYSLETTAVVDDSLKSVEVGSVLANLTWYHVTPAAGFDVEPFTLDLCVLVGDANGSGRITTADYAEIKAHMGEYTDARYDLNGSGRVTTADYSVVKAHMAERVPTKP